MDISDLKENTPHPLTPPPPRGGGTRGWFCAQVVMTTGPGGPECRGRCHFSTIPIRNPSTTVRAGRTLKRINWCGQGVLLLGHGESSLPSQCNTARALLGRPSGRARVGGGLSQQNTVTCPWLLLLPFCCCSKFPLSSLLPPPFTPPSSPFYR